MKNTFIDNKDGTVTDLTTGLMWQQETPTNEMYWEDAIEYCENLELAGHKDWRLPTIEELISLIAFDRHNPAIDTLFFPSTATHHLQWSSTKCAEYTEAAWLVGFYNGKVDSSHESFDYYVRAVRSI